MTVSFLIWLLPGYIASWSNHQVRASRNQSGWDFIARLGLLSAFFYVLSTTILSLLKNTNCLYLLDAIGEFADFLRLKPEDSGITVAICLAFFYGILLTKTPLRELLWKVGHIDPFTEFTRARLKDKKHILLNLKNGKVYVGQLAGITTDVNESRQYLSVGIELSGYRERDTHVVVFDKNYKERSVAIQERTLIISSSEVISMGQFSVGIHEQFVSEGITRLGAKRSDGQPMVNDPPKCPELNLRNPNPEKT